MERIHHRVVVGADRERVWWALTSPEGLDRWMTEAAALDLRPGGAYRFDYGAGIVSTGGVVAVDPPRRLVLADDVGHGDATVTITLEPEDGSTRVEVLDISAGSGTDWQWFREGVDRWWRDFLRNLVSVLETGEDLRRTTLWPEAELGVRYVTVPAGRGVVVLKLVPGSPAEATGLQPGDVIVSIGGRDIAGHHDVADTLQTFAPGDVVEVGALRDGRPVTFAVPLAPVHYKPRAATS